MKTILLATAAVLASMTSASISEAASAADRYIETAQGRLKVGRHVGVNQNSHACSVQVSLKGSPANRVYTVEVDPTMTNQNAPTGPTVISFSSKDARVFSDREGVRAVKNRGDDYDVLSIEKRASGKTFVRLYVEKPGTLKVAECLF